jgi:hypothetical protein
MKQAPAFEAPIERWYGSVEYEARIPTDLGLSDSVELRPARWVEVEAIGPSGSVVANAITDEQGRFILEAPPSAVRIAVLAQVSKDGHDLAVSPDPLGRQTYAVRQTLGKPSEFVQVRVSDSAPGGPGGAFHILDTVLRGAEAVREWSGQKLPPLYVYWGRGVTTAWSYYRGERRSGRFCLELLGGRPGDPRRADTDEHDESIVLHEFGHFVMERLATDSSPGGEHPAGHLIDPGLAWEEGRATWFSAAVLGHGRYADSVGREPFGRLRIQYDLETSNEVIPRGMGSEQGVAEVLWDLTDGREGYEDADDDGISVGPASLLQAMIELRGEPGAFPTLSSYLQYLVGTGRVDSGEVKTMLARTGQPGDLLPVDFTSRWPEDIKIPGTVNGKVDGVTHPAPSGGPNRPQNGFDSMRVYRVHIEKRSRLVAELRVFGTGRAVDHQDLDMELRDSRAQLLDSVRSEDSEHVLSRLLAPGWYVLYVRDGGTGNRVGFELNVSAEAQ